MCGVSLKNNWLMLSRYFVSQSGLKHLSMALTDERGLWLPPGKLTTCATVKSTIKTAQSKILSVLRVTEIFRSIQGESTHAGRPCTFVRLTGCPMRCSWCDSEYTFTGGYRISVDDVLKQVRAFGCRLVEVTGGEPLAQREAFELITRLCDEEYEVLIETGG